MGVYEEIRETLCCVTPALLCPFPWSLCSSGGFPGLVTHPLGQKRGDFGEIVVPGVSEVKLVEKVVRKRQKMLPARSWLALTKWEPWNLGPWDRRPSPEETQITPRKASPPSTDLTDPSDRYRSLPLKGQRSLQVINFTSRRDRAAEKPGLSLRARKWRPRLDATC